MKKSIVLLFVFLSVFVSNSDAKPTGFSVVITFGASPFCEGHGLCSIVWSSTAVKGSSNGVSQTMQVKGEIQNNMLVVNLPEKIDEKGRNEQGKFVYSISKDMVLDQNLAKEFGVEKLILAPGNYEVMGNTISLKILSTRESSTGSSGGTSNIAIDEQGVHKSTTPKVKSSSYDLKENKK